MYLEDDPTGNQYVTDELVQSTLADWRTRDLNLVLEAQTALYCGDFTEPCRAAVGWAIENSPLPLGKAQKETFKPLAGFLSRARRLPDDPKLDTFGKLVERQVFGRLGPVMELLEQDGQLGDLPKPALWRQELMNKGVLTEKDD